MRISTIIPVYNRADLIGETLRTVLEQDRPPAEVIVVDDGSSDGTCDAVAAFGRAVTLVRQANAGAGPARNAGFARSSGEIVHFMDSDDLCSLNTYALAAEAIAQGADMTYGPWLKTRIEGRALVDPEPFVIQQGPVRGDMAALAVMVDWVTVFQPCLFRRDLIERAGPYRADLKPSEDTELLCRIAAAARAPAHIAEAILLYRVHPENQVSEQNLARRLADRAHLWGVLQAHVDGGLTRLDARQRARFRRKKLRVAREAAAHSPEAAEALARDGTGSDRLVARLMPAAERWAGRLRRWTSGGNPYARPFAPGRLTQAQRGEIARLGYAFAAPGR